MDFIGQSGDLETGSALRKLERFLVAFYGNAVIAAILIFSSRNTVSAAIRTLLGTVALVIVSIQISAQQSSDPSIKFQFEGATKWGIFFKS